MLDILRVNSLLSATKTNLLYAKTDLKHYELLWVQPLLGQNIFAFLSSVDPKFPCPLAESVSPYLVILPWVCILFTM